MKRIKASCKAAINRKKHDIKVSIKKCGIRTLQDVLNTSILSNDAKIKHIRHDYTCYEKYLPTFYRDETGVALRNELNQFLTEFVKGQHSIEEFKKFNYILKTKLEAANDNYIQEKAKTFIQTNNEKVVKNIGKKEAKLIQLDPVTLSCYKKFSEQEKACLAKMQMTIRENASEEYKLQLCKAWISAAKNSWRDSYKRLAINSSTSINRYLVEIYLENRDPNFYPKDFKDLEFKHLRDVAALAKEWLLCKFDNNVENYTTFLNETLPDWIDFNNETHEDKLLEKL